ncbi:hypothetical protein [Sporomusa acidovorans]|uniref:Uncharacterized protein n=1 Tax=Sporomusa acidovorans (strain ATCC 49682 / DSM 3132 / Mol) TaxID=1123286 RepID=A0ABZ3J456_SPOA4|nr:hypothetical protein [Sporomusa acidovorans]OZC20939.1 hypothetical protein SPACI_23030 [Sporomusa acidovorans DSM 3132]SDE61610.1 hypothetical protein SAMN04488499_101793 [Sporomusa acidovorans]
MLTVVFIFICPLGLSAIATTLDAFSPKAVLIPDNVYGPISRFLNRRRINQIRYPAGASADEFRSVLLKARSEYPQREQLIVYIEAPAAVLSKSPTSMVLLRYHRMRSYVLSWITHGQATSVLNLLNMV